MYQLLYNKAIQLGASDFGISKNKHKRFFVVYNNKKINFGSKTGLTYFDHNDEIRRKNWYARHSKITDKNSELVIYKKSSPSYWSANILW